MVFYVGLQIFDLNETKFYMPICVSCTETNKQPNQIRQHANLWKIKDGTQSNVKIHPGFLLLFPAPVLLKWAYPKWLCKFHPDHVHFKVQSKTARFLFIDKNHDQTLSLWWNLPVIAQTAWVKPNHL